MKMKRALEKIKQVYNMYIESATKVQSSLVFINYNL